MRTRQEDKGAHWRRVVGTLVDWCGSQGAAAKEIKLNGRSASSRQLIRWLQGAVPGQKYRKAIESACERLGITTNLLQGTRTTFTDRPNHSGIVISAVLFRCVGPARYHEQRSYTVTVKGAGFGAPPIETPFFGVTDRFRIGNNAQTGFGEYGFLGDHKELRYQRWSASEIVMSGFKARPGDAVTLALWDQAGRGATWGGNVPPRARNTPRIDKVMLAAGGRNLHITVCGSGFGDAPRRMPFRGNLDHFGFSDFRSHSEEGSSLFSAGFAGFDGLAPTRVLLRYRSWSDNQIEIAGFSGTYGVGSAVVKLGDPATISIWNSAVNKKEGCPQTAWGGRILPTA